MLGKDVTPYLGDRLAAEVSRSDVRAVLERVLARGSPIQANAVHSVVRKMFGWAVEMELLPASPCVSLRAPAPTHARDRVLSPEEIRAWWTAAPRGRTVPDALRLILATAQRPGEVAGLVWEEIEGTWWTIPAERAKNGRSHRVHLSPLALEILGPAGTGPRFPAVSRNSSITTIGRGALAFHLTRKRAAWGTPVRWTPHDLRRTAASLMAGAGVSPFTVERVLNHTLQGVQAVYNRHAYDAEKKAALDLWAGVLAGIIG
jgi:integrase